MAADLLNDRVVPFLVQHDIRVLRVLTNRGTEYCAARETSRIPSVPESATLPQDDPDEFYQVGFRKKVYNTLDELQQDVDHWIHEYNTERTHSGKCCYGKTPMQTFLDSLALAKNKLLQTNTPKAHNTALENSDTNALPRDS